MKFKDDKIYYYRNYKIGLIISLIFCILAFALFPNIKNEKKEIPYFSEPIITLIDVPIIQQPLQSFPPLPPGENNSSLLEPLNEPELLPDVQIREAIVELSEENGTGKVSSVQNVGAYEVSSLPFIPRQILEVVPRKVEGVEGLIKVRVLIGVDGYVKSHEIIINTTNSNVSLQNVTDAIYKSSWQPINLEGQKVEYWIEKTYTFN